MFGKRQLAIGPTAAPKSAAPVAERKPAAVPPPAKPQPAVLDARLNDIRVGVFNALLDAVDLNELSKLTPDAVREELTDIISEIVNIKKFVLSAAEQNQLVGEICNDILGLGPLEPLLARDDIADIMVNGYDKVY